MVLPFVDVIGGFTDISGQLLELYKVRRDGSFFEQQSFLAEIRRQENEQVAASTSKREVLLHRLNEAKADAEDLRQAGRDLQDARLSVGLKLELDKHERQLANAPFHNSPSEVFDLANRATNRGSRPALLIAPFFNDDEGYEKNMQGPPTFRVALRRAWLDSPWSDDLAPLDGLISRPLTNTDVDLMIIRDTLLDLPVVLVHGEIQQSQRVWCSIVAWNLGPSTSSSTGAVSINLPPLLLPPGEGRLEFEDALGAAVARASGLLGQWFHLLRTGRKPSIRRSSQVLNEPYESVSASVASAYEVAMEAGTIGHVEARLSQAELCAEHGLMERAASYGSKALLALEEDPSQVNGSNISQLRSLVSTYGALRDSANVVRAKTQLEMASRKFVLEYLDSAGG